MKKHELKKEMSYASYKIIVTMNFSNFHSGLEMLYSVFCKQLRIS